LTTKVFEPAHAQLTQEETNSLGEILVRNPLTLQGDPRQCTHVCHFQGYPFIRVKANTEPKRKEDKTILLQEDIHNSLLQFGVGILVEFQDKKIPIRYGDLLHLYLYHQLFPKEDYPDESWGHPTDAKQPKNSAPQPGPSKSGDILYGTTHCRLPNEKEIPKPTLQVINQTIHQILPSAPPEALKILTCQLTKNKSVLILTGQSIANNPLPLLEHLRWYTPHHYILTAMQTQPQDSEEASEETEKG